MDRRTFLKGLVATAAGVLVPGQVLAEPERRVWALDRTMVQPERNAIVLDGIEFPVLSEEQFMESLRTIGTYGIRPNSIVISREKYDMLMSWVN